MNPVDEQRFFDLAMKVASGQSTNAERAELDALVRTNAELKAELAKLSRESRIAREVVPLLAAAESSAGEFPGYARERLQTKVRESVRGRNAGGSWNWRWLAGLAASAVAAVVILLAVAQRREAPVIEIALLETGLVRGAAKNEAGALTNRWQNAKVQTFSSEAGLRGWETNLPSVGKRVVRVICDAAAGEIRVIKLEGATREERIFQADTNISKIISRIDEYIGAK